MPAYKLFANTGIQFINTGIKATDASKAWSRIRQSRGEWVPWLYCKAVDGYCIFAVDTQTGPSKFGYFAQDEATINDPAISLTSIGTGELEDPVTICIQPEMMAGEPIDVALVLDFGNCRSLGLFVERDPHAANLLSVAHRFRLYSHARCGLDQFNKKEPPDKIEDVLSIPPYEEVFDSKFELVYDQLPRVYVNIFEAKSPPKPAPAPGPSGRRKLFGGGAAPPPAPPPTATTLTKVTRDSGLFPDFSPLRLGSEADDFRIKVDPAIGILTGMSSPKRYLWASRTVSGSFWHHILAIPRMEAAGAVTFEQLHGLILGYIYEDDHEWQAGKLPIEDKDFIPPIRPVRAKYPCRVMMILSLYELLAQAFSQVNSLAYRQATESPNRKRRLTHLVMSFPTAMCAHERGRYKTQATKAVRIFSHLCGRKQLRAPIEVRMSVDEGTAGQLAYVYGEVLACKTGRMWLELVGRPIAPNSKDMRARIASLDVGGGTTDLTIADYTDKAVDPQMTQLVCDIAYLDGMSKAGDELIKHLLERVLIPRLANELSVGKTYVRTFFESVHDPVFNAKKRRWITQIWVPLARRYLALAEEENEQAVFTLGDTCPDPGALDQMWEEMKSHGGDFPHPSGARFTFRREEFDKVVFHALGAMLFRFASVIASYDCDMLLLAGRPTRLPAVQRLLRWYLALPKSRIIPLDKYHTGPWYPFQDPKHPGQIEDPKSSVVVGTVVEYLCSKGWAPGNVMIEVRRSEQLRHSFYWGIARGVSPHFGNDGALFKPIPALADLDDSAVSEETNSFVAVGLETIIARRLTSDESAEASPVYCVNIRSAREITPIKITLKRSRSSTGEERLEAGSAEGTVDGQPAQFGKNVFLELRTLFEERYFLDTEAFYGIDYEAIIAD